MTQAGSPFRCYLYQSDGTRIRVKSTGVLLGR